MSCLLAPLWIFKLLVKEKFDSYWQGPFGKFFFFWNSRLVYWWQLYGKWIWDISILFQNSQCATMLIHRFCKSCEHEIVFVLIYRTNRTMSGSQLLQKAWIIKKFVVLLWKNWQKYESDSYSFSCNKRSNQFWCSKVETQ